MSEIIGRKFLLKQFVKLLQVPYITNPPKKTIPGSLITQGLSGLNDAKI